MNDAPELQIMAIWESINAGRFEAAESACSDLLQNNPDFSEAEFALGVALFRQGNSEEALSRLEKANDNVSALGLAARINLEKGNYERAIEMGRRAHELAEACLHASESTKKVRTPSMWQVRQPVYTTSVDRWKRYEPWLGKFRQLLDLSDPS